MGLDKYVEKLDQEAVLPEGPEERFSGYGVMGVTFSTGHVLALRHFPASSVGPGYSSVWHRDPVGMWEFYTDVEPHLSCPRYFGRAVASISVTPIHINWKGPNDFNVTVESPEVEWMIKLKNTATTSFLNLLSNIIPQSAWKNEAVLEKIERVASNVLETGELTLAGIAPNGQKFKANPRSIRLVEKSKAKIEGEDLGTVAPLRQQAHIGQFCIPNTALFVLGEAYFEPFDPNHHHLVTHIQTDI